MNLFQQIGTVDVRPSYRDRQEINATILKGASGAVRAVYEFYVNAGTIARLHGRVWIVPRNRIIAEALGLCRRSVIRAKQWLEANGLIRVEERHRPKAKDGKTRLADRIAVIRRPTFLTRLAGKLRLCGAPTVAGTGVTNTAVTFQAVATPPVASPPEKYGCDKAVTPVASPKNKNAERFAALIPSPEVQAELARLRAARNVGRA